MPYTEYIVLSENEAHEFEHLERGCKKGQADQAHEERGKEKVFKVSWGYCSAQRVMAKTGRTNCKYFVSIMYIARKKNPLSKL